MQKLILPLDNCQMTAGYKNEAYRKEFGFAHYGMDLSFVGSSDRTLKAMGDGLVKLAGKDNIYGNIVVVVYQDVVLSGSSEQKDLTVRLYHMESVSVKAGQTVKKGDKLGIMGNTGKYTTGTHVHVEIDTDTQYYNYGPGLAGDSNLIKAGVDTTLNPQDVLFIGGGQTYRFGAGKYGEDRKWRVADMEGKYIIRRSWSNPGSEIGRYNEAKEAVAACPAGYHIYDENGTTVYPFEENSYIWRYEQAMKELEKLKADGAEGQITRLNEELKKANDHLAAYEDRMTKIREIAGE